MEKRHLRMPRHYMPTDHPHAGIKECRDPDGSGGRPPKEQMFSRTAVDPDSGKEV